MMKLLIPPTPYLDVSYMWHYKHGKEAITTADYNSESNDFAAPKKEIVLYKEPKSEGHDSFNSGKKFSNETIKENCEIKEVQEVLNQDDRKTHFDSNEKGRIAKRN